MKADSSKVIFSLTQRQFRLLTDPAAKPGSSFGPDSRHILERRGLLARSGAAWERTRAGDKLLRALNALGVSL